MATGDKYRAHHARSLNDPEGSGPSRPSAIDWTKRWDKVLDAANPPFYRWFAGGELNACHNALDRHVGGGPRRADGADLRSARHQHARRASPIASCATSVATLAGA